MGHAFSATSDQDFNADVGLLMIDTIDKLCYQLQEIK